VADVLHRIATALGRAARRAVPAARLLTPEQRLAAFAAVGLFVVLFLPWYQDTVILTGGSKLPQASESHTGWGSFSFVEAAVLLVSAGVLTLLFQRAEGRAFHVPGGDGGVITAAGVWTCMLVIWRIFDKQGASTQGRLVTSYGIEWGIFFALADAGFLVYSGLRIRAAHRPEPPLPGEDEPPAPPPRPAAPEEPATRPLQSLFPRPDRTADEGPEASDQLTIPLHRPGDEPRP
jgi:hypothetical protein